MVESFQRTVEQDGQGYCVVASDLMRYLTIKATQAERTIWKKKKNPCWMKGLTAASVCCSANVGYRGRCERLFFFFLQFGEQLLVVVVVHQSQDQRCGLLAETQGHCWCDSVFCLSVCPASAGGGRHLPVTGAAHAKDLSGGQRDSSV